MIKVVFIGAGSVSFGTHLFRDWFRETELNGATLTLVDTNETNLDMMYTLATVLNKDTGSRYCIEKERDIRKALWGADFVITSIAIDRTRLWKLDFQIPKKHGLRHCLGENGGIGGLFFTLRTLPVLFDIVRAMEEICPQALLINFSNPENRIIHAVGRASSIQAVGLCHGIVSGIRGVATLLEKNPSELDVVAAGLNHLQWFLHIRDAATGEDLYPLLAEKDNTFDVSYRPLSRMLYRSFGYFPSPSDNHIGEYFTYGYEAGEEGYDFKKDSEKRMNSRALVDRLIARTEPLAAFLQPSDEQAVNIIRAIVQNEGIRIPSGIVYNKGIITNIPHDAAVEVPLYVDRTGIQPLHMGELPKNIARLCTQQAMVQQACIDAALAGSKKLAWEALLLDPVVTDTHAARAAFEELWTYNAPYIRPCS